MIDKYIKGMYLYINKNNNMLQTNLDRLLMIIYHNPMEYKGMQKKLAKYLMKYDTIISNIHEHKGIIRIYCNLGGIKSTVDISNPSPSGKKYDLELTGSTVYRDIEDFNSNTIDKLFVIKGVSLKVAFEVVSKISRY